MTSFWHTWGRDWNFFFFSRRYNPWWVLACLEIETIRHILHRKSIPFTEIEENWIQDLIVGGSCYSTYEHTCCHLTSVHLFHRCECEYHQACVPLSSVCGILHLVDTWFQADVLGSVLHCVQAHPEGHSQLLSLQRVWRAIP